MSARFLVVNNGEKILHVQLIDVKAGEVVEQQQLDPGMAIAQVLDPAKSALLISAVQIAAKSLN